MRKEPREWSWPVLLSSGCSAIGLFLVILGGTADERSTRFLFCFPLGMIMGWFALFGGLFALFFDRIRSPLNLALLIPALLVAAGVIVFTFYVTAHPFAVS